MTEADQRAGDKKRTADEASAGRYQGQQADRQPGDDRVDDQRQRAHHRRNASMFRVRRRADLAIAPT